MRGCPLVAGALLLAFHLSCAFAADRPSRFEKQEDVVAWLYRDFGWEILIDHYVDNDLLIDQPESVLSRYFSTQLANLIAKDRKFEIKTTDGVYQISTTI